MSHATTSAITAPFKQTTKVIPPGLKWSSEMATQALNKRTFIRVDEAKGKVVYRFMTGATRSWSSSDPAENQTIFNVEFRITGTPENVRNALSFTDYAEEVDAIIDESITSENFNNTKADIYNQEIDDRDSIKKAKVESDNESIYGWNQYFWFASPDGVNGMEIVSKGAPGKGQPLQGAKKVGAKDLASRLANITPGNMLDVTQMDLEKGIRIFSKKIPADANDGKSVRTGKCWSDGIDIMTNDITRYIKALKLIFGADAENSHADHIANVERRLNELAALTQAKTAEAAKPRTLPTANVAVKPTKQAAPIQPPPVQKAALPKAAPKAAVASPKTRQPIKTIGIANAPTMQSHRRAIQS